MIGIVKRIKDKHFGFIRGSDGRDYFFHEQDFIGFWNDLEEDFNSGMEIQVDFKDDLHNKKGPRASNVNRLDWPNSAPKEEL